MQMRSIFVGCEFSPRDDDRQWFAVRVRSNFEKPAGFGLGAAGLEHLLPVYRLRRRYYDRTREVERPLFPGYVFGRFAIQDRFAILRLPGYLAIVGNGRVPAPVDEAEILALRTIMASEAYAEPWPFLQAGDRVVVERGALSGLEGILVCSRKNDRIIVSVTLLQRSVALEIDRDSVRPLAPRSRSWQCGHHAPVVGVPPAIWRPPVHGPAIVGG